MFSLWKNCQFICIPQATPLSQVNIPNRFRLDYSGLPKYPYTGLQCPVPDSDEEIRIGDAGNQRQRFVESPDRACRIERYSDRARSVRVQRTRTGIAFSEVRISTNADVVDQQWRHARASQRHRARSALAFFHFAKGEDQVEVNELHVTAQPAEKPDSVADSVCYPCPGSAN